MTEVYVRSLAELIVWQDPPQLGPRGTSNMKQFWARTPGWDALVEGKEFQEKGLVGMTGSTKSRQGLDGDSINKMCREAGSKKG